MLKNILLIVIATLSVAFAKNDKKEELKPFARSERFLTVVLPIVNETSNDTVNSYIENGDALLITALQKTKRYRLIERERLDAIMQEQSLSVSGMISDSTATEVGELLGADAILYTKVTHAEYHKSLLFGLIAWIVNRRVYIDLSARVVDVKTGEVLATASTSSEGLSRKYVFLGLPAGGKESVEQIYTMAVKNAIDDLAYKLAQNAERK